MAEYARAADPPAPSTISDAALSVVDVFSQMYPDPTHVRKVGEAKEVFDLWRRPSRSISCAPRVRQVPYFNV